MTLGRTMILLGAVACVSCGAAGEGISEDAGPKGDGAMSGDRAGPRGHDGGTRQPRDSGRRDALADAGRDTGHDAGPAYPAAHHPMPRVKNLGGPVLAHPRVVPVFFAGDPLLSTMQTFFSNLTTAKYWAGATAEYGVGALTVTAPVIVTDPAPTTTDDPTIQAWIATEVDRALAGDAGAGDAGEAGVGEGGSPAWPAPDGNTIYTLFYPATTTISLGGLTSCSYFGGYHSEAGYSTGSTPYAVLPRCSTFVLLPGAGTTDILTGAVSHELAEAATDPFPVTNLGYAEADFAGSGWSQVMVGGEIGDMCVLEPSSFTTADVGFNVQRVWSNANAAAGHDPCAPVPAGEVYFTAIPELENAEMYPGQYVDGIRVAAGSTVTVKVHLVSDAPTAGPFTVSAVEAGQDGTQIPPDPTHQLSLSLDKTTGQNGDVIQLTLTRAPLASGEMASGLAFRIESTLGTSSHSYWGVAGY